MEHPIKEIAKRYADMSECRQDKKQFSEAGFIQFAIDNKDKYSLIENETGLLVSTWYSNDLIEDYRKTL